MLGRLRHFGLVAIALVIVIYATGCVGRLSQTPRLPQTGSIQGRVTGPTGAGVGGVYVQLAGTPTGTFSDANGVYTFSGLAPGSYTVVAEVPVSSPVPGVQAMALGALLASVPAHGQPKAWALPADVLAHEPQVERVSLVVHVMASQVAVAESITVPVFGDVDSVFLYHSTPRVGHPITAGETLDVFFDIHYALNSAGGGYVVVAVLMEDESGNALQVFEDGLYRAKGSGSATFTGSFKVPEVPYLDFIIILFDEDGWMLAMKRAGGYPVQGGDHAIAPRIEIDGYSNHQLVFSVEGGNLKDFARYELHASRSNRPDCQQPPVATFVDPTVEKIALTQVGEGDVYYYQLCLHTTQGSIRPSNIVSYVVPAYGVDRVVYRRDLSDLVADPLRDLIYLADPFRNEVLVVSTVTHAIEKAIPVGQGPGALAVAAGGAHLYVGHTGTDAVAVINLVTLTIESWLTDLPRTTALAVDQATGMLYAGIVRDNKRYIVAIDPATNSRQSAPMLNTTTDILRIDIRDAGRLLFVGSDRAYVFDAANLTELATIGSDTQYAEPFIIGDRLYLAQYIYDADTLLKVDDNINRPIAYNDSDDRLYVFGGPLYGAYRAREDFSTIYELTPGDTGTWQPAFRLPLNERVYGSKILLTPDGRYLYVAVMARNGRVDLLRIDLEARRAGVTL